MMGDTPVNTVQNRQCIDNVSDYDSEHHRISKSVHHRLDLGPNMLLGAQQHTTVESTAALKIQDKIEGKYNENMQSNNGQYRNEMYKRAENMIPQLDGTFNISDNSDSDLHSYLDLAGANIILYRTRGQKQRHDENERANTNRHSALKDYTKTNTKVKIQRQKVPDDEDIDIDKIVKGDKPKDDRKSATKIERQSREKEAKRLALEKAKRIQIQKDPVGEAIDVFKHTLDKTALVWFQINRSKFKDLTTLKTMFLQRYNPWGKTKRKQLQSWNILSFDPKNTDVDEHIDLINTLDNMVDQKEEAKMEKFIETMPMMIQTHLIICKDWADVKDTVKSLEHIIQKCDPPTPTMPMMATGATVLELYSHIAHLVDKEEGKIPQPFKGAKPKQTRGRGKPKGKPHEQRQNPPKAQEADETYAYESPNNYYHNDNYNASSQSQDRRPFTG